MMRHSSCLIVGAGISGLLAAHRLKEDGIQVTILEKSRGVGGRMATRRIGGGTCDHGAQFITAKEDRFRELVTAWEHHGLIVPWCDGFPDAGGHLPPARHQRFRSVPSMTSVPKFLASELDVRLNHRAIKAEAHDRRWRVTTENGSVLSAESLLLTAPLPQSLALFSLSNIPVPPDIVRDLQSVLYHPCISLMLVLDGPSSVPLPGAVQLGGPSAAWIADNSQKGVSPGVPALTVHASHVYSEGHFESPDDEITQTLTEAVERYLGGSTVKESLVHRWRYAEPISLFPAPILLAQHSPPLLLAGDAFGGSRVEAAALSGVAAAEALLALP